MIALEVTGCSTPPWAQGASPPSPDHHEHRAAAAVPNDLSSGSTARALTTGPLTVDVDYWSTDDGQVAADALKPVSVSLITAMTAERRPEGLRAAGDDGRYARHATETLDALSAQVDSATTSPGYLVLTPYSYSQTFTVGPTPAEATT